MRLDLHPAQELCDSARSLRLANGIEKRYVRLHGLVYVGSTTPEVSPPKSARFIDP